MVCGKGLCDYVVDGQVDENDRVKFQMFDQCGGIVGQIVDVEGFVVIVEIVVVFVEMDGVDLWYLCQYCVL